MKNAVITGSQVKKIHTLKTAMGLDDDLYRGALFQSFGVRSSKDLTAAQAEEVIRDFKTKAVAMGLLQRPESHRDLKGRNGFATPAQLSFIQTLWSDVTRAEGEKDKAKALRSFLQRQAGVSDLRFLRSEDAPKVIFALKAMKKQKSGTTRK